MTTGYFENGRPHVSAHVEIRRLNIRGTIPLLVDTGADDVDPRLPSLLGQDILRNWRTIHEPALQRLEFMPRTADILDA